MEFGASIFFTDYSITPTALAAAMEERGFESLWAAEHSHIPVPRRTPAPGGGELAKRYYDVMDPFVTLAVAAAATKRLKVATGICLVIQRDTDWSSRCDAAVCSRVFVVASLSQEIASGNGMERRKHVARMGS